MIIQQGLVKNSSRSLRRRERKREREDHRLKVATWGRYFFVVVRMRFDGQTDDGWLQQRELVVYDDIKRNNWLTGETGPSSATDGTIYRENQMHCCCCCHRHWSNWLTCWLFPLLSLHGPTAQFSPPLFPSLYKLAHVHQLGLVPLCGIHLGEGETKKSGWNHAPESERGRGQADDVA